MAKTNKYGFVFRDEDNLGKLTSFLTDYHYCAVISPLHSEDHWTVTDIERFVSNNENKHGIKIKRTAESFEIPSGKHKIIDGRRVPEMLTVRIPEVNDKKIPHRHVMVKYDYSVMATQVREEFAQSGFEILYFEPIKSERAYLRYFCHLDNPEKAQYLRDDVISLAYDLEGLYQDTRQDKQWAIEEMHQIADVKKCQTVRQFAKVLRQLKRKDLLDKLMGSSNYWRQYLYRGGQIEKAPNDCS